MAQPTVTGAAALVAACEREGATHVFGYPGGANIPIFDALYDSDIRFILSRHEQGAVHMADGFARAAGRAGVALVTSGPGATNAITGLLTAHMDSVPLVAVCGQVATSHLGLEAFQEADVSGISFPVVKHSYLVKDVRDIPRIVKEAFFLAQSGRPGPVLIDLPKDIAAARCAPDYDAPMNLPGYRVPADFDTRETEKVARLLSHARRPVLLVGHGALLSGAADAVRRLAEKCALPVTTTLLGKGAFPETHPLSLGMLGMHGTAYANLAVKECDMILSIGSRWDDRIIGDAETFCTGAIKAHIDIDLAEKNKMIATDHFILGDARPVVEELIARATPGDVTAWRARIDAWKEEFALRADPARLTARSVLAELDRCLDGAGVIATDVGQHQMWAAQFVRVNRPNHWLSSGGAGTMGFGLPAAIGAQFALPDERVTAVVGDGGFQMTMPELATAAINKLPITILILDNRYLGMVRQWQDLFYDNRTFGVDLSGNPDFLTIGQGYGIKGVKLSSPERIAEALDTALAYRDGPFIVHAEIEKQVNVFPMIPAGKGYDAMMPVDPRAKQASKGSS
jgi:acetolactate synthase-1/2/3 large subunit